MTGLQASVRRARLGPAIRCLRVVLGAVVVWLAACRTAGDEAGGPGPGASENAIQFPESPVGKAIEEHLSLAIAVGHEAEAEYQASLENLRAQADEVAEALVDVYDSAPEERYFSRWLIVETLRELRFPGALDGLAEIASAPIPAERFQDSHRFSQDKEASIRVTAVRGIGDLAVARTEGAEELLLGLVSHENLSVRREAIRGYLRAGVEGGEVERRAAILRQRLPESDHVLVTLEVTDPRAVPHPDVPESFDLPEAGSRTRTPPPKVPTRGGAQ